MKKGHEFEVCSKGYKGGYWHKKGKESIGIYFIISKLKVKQIQKEKLLR